MERTDNKEVLYRTLLLKYGKYIVHMRQQFHLSTSKLGLVLGAGISINVGLPDWDTIVKTISEREDIKKLGIKIDTKSDPISNAQLLFQAYKTHLYSVAEDHDKEYNRIEMTVQAKWREIIHSALYHSVSDDITQLVHQDDYLWSLIEVIKKTPMTINYNFDDTLQRMLYHIKKRNKESRGYTTLWNTNIYMYPKMSVIYHPNGYLPYRLNEHPSEKLVFQEDTFADQLIDSINGHYNVLMDYFTHNTCLLIGLSLRDPTLKHILRNNAVNYPGTYHYYIKYVPSREDNINEKTFAEANFDVYNLITLFLTEEEIGALLDLITLKEQDFKNYLQEIGKPISYRYILVGAVGAGKTTALSFFRSIRTIDEWSENMPVEMAKDPSRVDNEKITAIDNWIADQWYRKNNNLIENSKSPNITIIDRGPLDPLAFTPKGAWKSKCEMIKDKISPGKSNKQLCSAEIIFLKGDPSTMASRAILIQRDTDKDNLERQQKLIEYIYSHANAGFRTIDTRDKGKEEVARAIARIIFIEEYEEAPLHKVLEDFIHGEIKEPNRLFNKHSSHRHVIS